MKLLLIEDNARLATSIKKNLTRHYVVDTAETGADGLLLATAHHYQLIILDLVLPDMSGNETCRKLRAAGVDAPILVLTGVREVEKKVTLLDSGADDYLTKPFNIRELEARLNALSRRLPVTYNPDIISAGSLILDHHKRTVTRNGQVIHLRRKEFDILEYLVRNRGRAVSRTMIMQHAWENGAESWNNTVDVHIKYLRDKIDRPFKQQMIKTAYGIGYMLDDAA